jgi:hypothetical protein
MSEFAAFDKIERLTQQITITEKIHGTNAQVFIADGIVRAGSRTRWITPEDDNYAFAAWVASNAHALRELLGEGQHFGEWYGSGINAGYGLKERRFALFNTFRWVPLADTLRPLGIDVVPILYQGPFSGEVISTAFERLRTLGSVLVPGYDKPEGIVVRFDRSGVLMKRTFESEDEAWSYKKDRPPAPDHSEVAARLPKVSARPLPRLHRRPEGRNERRRSGRDVETRRQKRIQGDQGNDGRTRIQRMTPSTHTTNDKDLTR